MKYLAIAALIAIALLGAVPAGAGTVLGANQQTMSMAPNAHQKTQNLGYLVGTICRFGAYYCWGVGAGPVGTYCTCGSFDGAWSNW